MIDYPDEGALSSEIDESNSTEKMSTEEDDPSGDINIEQQEKNDLQNNNNNDVEQELLAAVDNIAGDDDATATAPNDDESSVNKSSNIMADKDEQEQQQTTIEESRTSHQSRGFLPLRAFRNKNQDEFVKNGARVKAVFTSSFRVVANGLSSTNNNTGDSNGDNNNVGDNNNNSSGSNGKRKISKTDFVHAQDLAQEKTEECMALKRQLEDYQTKMKDLQNEISTSRQNYNQLKAKNDRTAEALQIAGSKAANARAEADASNARAESLSGQLNDLQSVIEETKRGMEVVRSEHDEVSRASRSVEARLIQVESELIRADRGKKDAVDERDFLKARAEKAEKVARELQDENDDCRDENRVLKKDVLELQELEKVRSDRTARVEVEFQETRSSLLEATCACAEAESTVTALRSVIEELRAGHETQHEQIESIRDKQSHERAKQNEALTLAERQAQQYKMLAEEKDEEIRKLKMDKTAAEKQVDTMKLRLSRNESNKQQQLASRSEKVDSASGAASLSAVTPHHTSNNLGFINSFGAKDDAASVVSEDTKMRKFVSELPKRETSSTSSKASSSTTTANTTSIASKKLTYSNQKENQGKQKKQSAAPQRKAASRTVCCLCQREGGMILKCQCDYLSCNARAHPMCIGKFRGNNNNGKTVLCKEAKA